MPTRAKSAACGKGLASKGPRLSCLNTPCPRHRRVRRNVHAASPFLSIGTSVVVLVHCLGAFAPVRTLTCTKWRALDLGPRHLRLRPISSSLSSTATKPRNDRRRYEVKEPDSVWQARHRDRVRSPAQPSRYAPKRGTMLNGMRGLQRLTRHRTLHCSRARIPRRRHPCALFVLA